MNIYTTLQRGEYHLNHCEDYLITANINPTTIVCAVMDGCTMGTDSYLISTITGKLLRKIVKARSYAEFYFHDRNEATGYSPALSSEAQLKEITLQLFRELNILRNQLQLERNELLTTLLLLVADTQRNNGAILIVGDGVIGINGTVNVFDQDNKPDYLGYHLAEDPGSWYGCQQRFIFHDLSDISIATDGILSFTAFNETSETTDPVSLLLLDNQHAETEEMLNRKVKMLEHIHGLKHTDDLAMIRLIR